jgi:hypothetical protein
MAFPLSTVPLRLPSRRRRVFLTIVQDRFATKVTNHSDRIELYDASDRSHARTDASLHLSPITVKDGAAFMSQTGPLKRSFDGDDGFAFVVCRICGDHRGVISGRHLSKHGTDRKTYVEEYDLSPDELIAKEFAYTKFPPWLLPEREDRMDWRDEDGLRSRRQRLCRIPPSKYPHLYEQGVWIFGDWDKALCAAGFDPTRTKYGNAAHETKRKSLRQYVPCTKASAPLRQIHDGYPCQAILSRAARIRILVPRLWLPPA